LRKVTCRWWTWNVPLSLLDFTDPADTPANVPTASSPQCGFLKCRTAQFALDWPGIGREVVSLTSFGESRTGGEPALLPLCHTLTHRASPAG
jgi:hypothetical protein